DEYVLPLLDYRPDYDEHVICDRWHWGEWVYPRVLGRSSLMDEAVFWYVEAFLRSRGAYVVRPTTALQKIERCLRVPGYHLIKPGQLGGLLAAYRVVGRQSTLRSCTVSPVTDRQLNDVIASARVHEDRARALNEYVTYVGPPSPSYLLLGDVRNRTTGAD